MAAYDDGRPDSVRRYLLEGERCVVVTHRHWVVLVEPWAVVVGSLLLVAWLTFDVADPSTVFPVDLLWWLWFALLVRAAWQSMDRTRTWFIATDRRLLLVYGVVVRHVAMMPLAKVTDMHYQRSPLGHLLGYGTFVLESAGQDQALREIDMVPDPDTNYRAIVDKIFHKDVDDEVAAAEAEDGDDDYPRPQQPTGWPDEPGWLTPRRPRRRRWRDLLRGRARWEEQEEALEEAPLEEPHDGRAVARQVVRSTDLGVRRFGGALRGHRYRERATPDPGVGARHEVAPGPAPGQLRDPGGAPKRSDRSLFDPEERESGESLYRSGGDDDQPRDATGYWA